jgi:mannose-1-phosphate guanylyltransferase
MKIIPVILSGGFEARLWSLSRKEYPKQYLQQYNLGRYLIYKYNKENLLNQWLLVRSKP